MSAFDPCVCGHERIKHIYDEGACRPGFICPCKAFLDARPAVAHERGWWNMACWNGLSPAQQLRLVAVGNLPFGYTPEGACPRGASVCIEVEGDIAPGPRFYCLPCARARLAELQDPTTQEETQ